MKSAWIKFCISLCAVGLAAGSGHADDSRSIRIGATHDIGAAALYIADAKGYFQNEDLPAELKFFDSEVELRDAAGRGDIDFGVSRLDASFFNAAAKNHLKAIASEVSDQSLYPADGLLTTRKIYREGLRDPRNFPERRFGILADFDESGANYSLARIAAKYKLNRANFHFIRLDSPAAGVEALSRGEVNAVIMPYVTAREASDSVNDALVLRFSDFIERQAGVVFARAEVIAKSRDVVERFVRAYRRGVQEYDVSFQLHDEEEILPGPNYKEYLQLMARQTNLPEAAVQNALPYCDHLARLDVTDVARQLRFWQKEGKADAAIAAGRILDTNFFEHINLADTAY